MNSNIINPKTPLRGGTPLKHGLTQITGNHCATDGTIVDAMLGLGQILAFMPRQSPQGALDTHLLLFPLNVLRLTEAIVRTVISLPDAVHFLDLDADHTWSSLFAVPCSLVKMHHGDYHVRVAWQIQAISEQCNHSLNRRHMIRQWAIIIRQLQCGQPCPLLGLHRATGVGIRHSASKAVNALIQALPDLLDDLAETVVAGEARRLPDAMLAFCASIRIALKDAACSPLYEELSEFILSTDDVDHFLPRQFEYTNKIGSRY